MTPRDILPPDAAGLADQLEERIGDSRLSTVKNEVHPFTHQRGLGYPQTSGQPLQAAVLFRREQDLNASHEVPFRPQVV